MSSRDTNMLERVAHAVQQSMTITKLEAGQEPVVVFKPPLSDCMHIARAAIEAMEEV